jgi:hypothetical protein
VKCNITVAFNGRRQLAQEENTIFRCHLHIVSSNTAANNNIWHTLSQDPHRLILSIMAAFDAKIKRDSRLHFIIIVFLFVQRVILLIDADISEEHGASNFRAEGEQLLPVRKKYKRSSRCRFLEKPLQGYTVSQRRRRECGPGTYIHLQHYSYINSRSEV